MRRHPRASAASTRQSSRPAAGTCSHLILSAAALMLVILALPAAALAENAPTVSGVEASEVGVTTARLSGRVNPHGASGEPSNVSWRIEYTRAGEGAWNFANGGTIEPPASEEAADVEVEAITGFEPGTEYEVRLVAEDGAGTAEETGAPFTTQAATEPVLATQAADQIGYTLATLHGTIDPEGGNVNPVGPETMAIFWSLEWREAGVFGEPGEGWNFAGGGELSGAEAEATTPVPVVAELGAGTLRPGHSYEVRLHDNYLNFAREGTSPEPFETFETLSAQAPSVTIEAVPGTPSGTVHLSGTVDPHAPAGAAAPDEEAAFRTGWQFVCEPGCEGALSGTIEADPGTHEFPAAPVTVEGEAAGLEPHQTYTVKLVASDAAGQGEATENAGQPVGFTTGAVAPEVFPAGVSDLTQSSVRLDAFVNPHNSALTDCHFDWGTTAAYGNTAPCSSQPTGNAQVLVTAQLTGLQEATTYHYRAVVANPQGGAQTGDFSFETRSAESCPNESIREEQGSQALPECRAYEMVSPPDKNGGDIPGDGVSVTAAADGEAVAFTSRGSFGDTVGAGPGGQTMYVARRGSTGWIDHGATPQGQYDALVSAGGVPLVVDFSSDLRNAVVWGYDLPGVPGELRTPNIYAEDTATDALSLVTQPLAGPQPLGFMAADYNRPNVVGVSEDSRHIAFTGFHTRLLEEAPVGVPSVYEWDNGELRLASVLPDGSIAANGAALADPNTEDTQQAYRHTLSPDGSRVLFQSPAPESLGEPFPPDAQLYERIDHARTVEISESENPSFAGEAEDVVLQEVTGDSRHVIFDTTSPLLEEDHNNGADLYLFTEGPDPEHERNLTLITKTGSSARLNGGVGPTPVIGSSDDGSLVYYATDGDTIELWQNGQTTTIAKKLAGSAALGTSLSATASTPGNARVTSDGRYLSFGGSGTIESGGPDPLVGDAAGHSELYLYDAATNRLRCASCPGTGAATADASIVPSVTHISPTNELPGTRPSFLASDGKVFFSTTQSLVPQDVNGVSDAYEFDPATGSVSLLTTGTSSDAAAFVGAGADGRNVFIVTRGRLVRADRDGFVDMYDVRVGGGYPEPPPGATPCSGEACQAAAQPPGAPPIAPAVPGGNVHPARHRKHHHRRHHHLRHHHRKAHHHPTHHRTARQSRRAGR